MRFSSIMLVERKMSKKTRKTKKNDLRERLEPSLTGKMILAYFGGWLVGKYLDDARMVGTDEQIKSVSNALMSSKRFQEELDRPGATVESVIDKMRIKQMSAQEFERVFGIDWPF